MPLHEFREVPLLRSFGSQIRDDTILLWTPEMISSFHASPSPMERSSQRTLIYSCAKFCSRVLFLFQRCEQ